MSLLCSATRWTPGRVGLHFIRPQGFHQEIEALCCGWSFANLQISLSALSWRGCFLSGWRKHWSQKDHLQSHTTKGKPQCKTHNDGMHQITYLMLSLLFGFYLYDICKVHLLVPSWKMKCCFPRRVPKWVKNIVWFRIQIYSLYIDYSIKQGELRPELVHFACNHEINSWILRLHKLYTENHHLEWLYK